MLNLGLEWLLSRRETIGIAAQVSYSQSRALFLTQIADECWQPAPRHDKVKQWECFEHSLSAKGTQMCFS